MLSHPIAITAGGGRNGFGHGWSPSLRQKIGGAIPPRTANCSPGKTRPTPSPKPASSAPAPQYQPSWKLLRWRRGGIDGRGRTSRVNEREERRARGRWRGCNLSRLCIGFLCSEKGPVQIARRKLVQNRPTEIQFFISPWLALSVSPSSLLPFERTMSAPAGGHDNAAEAARSSSPSSASTALLGSAGAAGAGPPEQAEASHSRVKNAARSEGPNALAGEDRSGVEGRSPPRVDEGLPRRNLVVGVGSRGDLVAAQAGEAGGAQNLPNAARDSAPDDDQENELRNIIGRPGVARRSSWKKNGVRFVHCRRTGPPSFDRSGRRIVRSLPQPHQVAAAPRDGVLISNLAPQHVDQRRQVEEEQRQAEEEVAAQAVGGVAGDEVSAASVWSCVPSSLASDACLYAFHFVVRRGRGCDVGQRRLVRRGIGHLARQHRRARRHHLAQRRLWRGRLVQQRLLRGLGGRPPGRRPQPAAVGQAATARAIAAHPKRCHRSK